MLLNLETLLAEDIRLQESSLDLGSTSYWHSAFIDNLGQPISGGFGINSETSRKIAYSELLERRFFRNLVHESAKGWGLDLIPTACGFAVGYDIANVIERSVCEAVERWVMTQWIDHQKEITRVSADAIKMHLDPASEFFLSHFDDVWFFEKTAKVLLADRLYQVSVVQTMGFKGEGVFPGSGTSTGSQPAWQHALLESMRHLLAVQNNPPTFTSFPMNKVRFFANNAETALEQINRAKDTNWPTTRVKFFRVEEQSNPNYWVARTILADWESWHRGPLERFLY